MKSSNYVVIQGWMCNELNLKGNELLVFALIYGFSQDGESVFTGSRNYIAETFNISKPTVDKTLQTLIDRGYILKYESEDTNAPNMYGVNIQVVKKFYWGSKETLLDSKETLQGGSKETLLNNTSKYTTSKKDKENKKIQTQQPVFEFGKQRAKKDNLFTKCVNLIDSYTFCEEARKLLVEYLQFRLSINDKPLYANMWKGMLSKLQELTDDHGYTDQKLCIRIIKQSIEKGYLSFYPISEGTRRTESGTLHVPVMTEEDYAEEEEQMAELEAQGIQVRF